MNKGILFIVLITIITVFTACTDGSDSAPQASPASSSRLATLLGNDDESGFPRVTEPRRFEFPADHGPHPEYRNEWWYVTGNLDTASGDRVGFEVTLFRVALSRTLPESPSNWRGQQLYMGHFALTDVAGGEFVAHERFARNALGLAGATAAPFRVWLEDWEFGRDADGFFLRAAADDAALDLRLEAQKAPVLNGVDGLSQKSPEPGNASYYYSITRLATAGELRLGGRRVAVSGTSWLDREWGSSALAANQVGWDWFALQLEDGTELMYYQIRGTDGAPAPNSAGTFVAADGSQRTLAAEDVAVEVVDYWDSPLGGRYPHRWRLSIPKLQLRLDVQPVLAEQELNTSVRYWEGAVDVVGQKAEQPLGGRGYVELTGYAEGAAGQ